MYGASGGADALESASLETVGQAVWVWRMVGGVLVLFGGLDLIIGIDIAMYSGQIAAAIVTWSGVVVALLISAALTVTSRVKVMEPKLESRQVVAAASNAEDKDLFKLIQDKVLAQDLYLDPNLNLAKLARKVGTSARQVSQQINQKTGLNVSQYINGFRIRQVCELLSQTDKPVTQIMYDAGFQTKSNFNRVFLRLTKLSPSQWRNRRKSQV